VTTTPPATATLRRLERASGALATKSVARMDETLPWFRAMPADQRSWVMLIAQAGIASFVEWLRSPGDAPRLTTEVFRAGPQELARSVNLQQAVELVRVTVEVVEGEVEGFGAPGDRLVVVLGGVEDAMAGTRPLLPEFGAGPVVVGPTVADLGAAGTSARAALAGIRAVPGWPAAPRPVFASDLLAERALSGDEEARRTLVEDVYRPLAEAGSGLLDTVTAYAESGSTLEGAARALFVHPNTVRYRLRRVAEVCGRAPTDPRDLLTLQLALVLGRLADLG
jgi:hypothetical protein